MHRRCPSQWCSRGVSYGEPRPEPPWLAAGRVDVQHRECRKTGSVNSSGERVPTGTLCLTAQRDALAALGVAPKRLYVDHGLTGTNRDRPGLNEAMAACRRPRHPRREELFSITQSTVYRARALARNRACASSS